MTQSDLKSLIDKGADAGTVWAAVQNHCAQQIEAARADAITASAKQLAETRAALSAEKSAHDLTIENGNKQIEAIAAEAKAALAARDNALAAYKTNVANGIAAIKGAVLDPNTPTDETVLAIIADATKDERTRQREALEAQKSELEKQLAALE